MTCGESNYPIYGGGKKRNRDTSFNRTSTSNVKAWDEKIRDSLLFKTIPHNRIKLVEFNCQGWASDRINRNISLAMVAISSFIYKRDQDIDQGLLPPAVSPTVLSDKQVTDIATCAAEEVSNRPFFVTYAGNLRGGGGGRSFDKQFHTRLKFHKLHDDKEIFVRRYFNTEFKKSKLSKYTYQEVNSQSIFSLAPRGDNKFSYRFTEVLSAGAIPVVLADEWMWPFRPELIDWNECAVIMPEKDAGAPTIEVLRNISIEQRCRMRQRCYEIYKKYGETTVGTIDGIVQGLELVAQGHHKPMVGVRCNASEPESDQCNLHRR